MSLYVILETPGAFDFAAFTRATRGTLALLASLLEFKNCDPAKSLQFEEPISGFVKAIRLGTSAAQCGFTAAEDILTLSELVQSTSLEERLEYLNGTLELANQAYAQSKEAQQVFRAVRTEIMSIIEKLNNAEVVPKRSNWTTQYSLEERRRGIEALDGFEKHISALADWWDWIKIETKVQRGGKSAIINFDDSSLRERSVIDRWKLLRAQFLDYTNMVGQLEDSYPQLFTRLYQIPTTDQRPQQTSYQDSKRGFFRPDLRRALNVIRRSHSRQKSCLCVII